MKGSVEAERDSKSARKKGRRVSSGAEETRKKEGPRTEPSNRSHSTLPATSHADGSSALEGGETE